MGKMKKDKGEARLDAILHEEMEDLIYQRFPQYDFSPCTPVFQIPRKPVSDDAFMSLRQDLMAITFNEQSALLGSTKDKIYFVRRIFHHVLRVVNKSVPPGEFRVGLTQRMWFEGRVEAGSIPWPSSVRHHADLVLTAHTSSRPLSCIEVRDEEVEFKQAMTRMTHASRLIGAARGLREVSAMMTDLKTWWFQRLFLTGGKIPERLTLTLKFDAEGVIDTRSLRTIVEALHGFVLHVRKNAVD